MAVPRNKHDLLLAVEDTFRALDGDLDRVPEDRARDGSMPGHAQGTWMSPADLVAYLIGWNELVLSWHADRARGIEPEFPAPGVSWTQLGDLAQRFYREHSTRSWPELRDRLRGAKERIVVLIEERDDAFLYADPWYGKHTAGRMIQLNTVSPYRNARRRLRAWLRETGIG
jgi:hypothetical protein